MPRVNDFDQYLAWFRSSDFSLPFEFGGATQCGRLNAHNNNQDSLAVIGHNDRLVGVVCDGCGSAARGYSNNEVGSRLISLLTANLSMNHIKEGGVNSLAGTLSHLEKNLCERITDISGTLVTQEQLGPFLESFLMTTIVAFVVDPEDFVLFGCGDGLVAVNGKFTDLESQSGEYLTNRLLGDKNWKEELEGGHGALKILDQGKTVELTSLLIATDGFMDLQQRFPELINEFITRSDEVPANGYNEMMAAEFRRRVCVEDAVEAWAENQDAHDDRTFLLLRRVEHEVTKEQKKCSKSRRRRSQDRGASSVPSPASAPAT